MEQFAEALTHCTATGQTATGWMVSQGVEGVLYHGDRMALKGGPEFMGLPVSFDADLPLNKVVLKAGQNTVSAFVVPLIIDLDNS